MVKITIYVLGFALSLIELVLSFFHKSLCDAYSCKLVASYVKYGESVIIFIGVVVFFVLIILELSKHNLKEYIIDTILISAFATEGLLLSFQIFSLKVICYFCFSIFLIFLILVVLRLLQKHYSMLFAIGAFISVFFMSFLIMPNLSPLKSGYDLFYSKTCPHCEKTVVFLEKMHISINKYSAQNYRNFLNNIGINEIPVLFVNLPNEKKFVIGQENIEKYFGSRPQNNSYNFQNNNYNILNNSQTCIIGDNCTK